ncbi:O-glycosyl hydrolase [Anaerotaenia torta]|uniref:cellulase family glycosylhydrolase n=1 Tax=Anaerotaenia torta TaxID=433293 RepID=UPI003D1A45B3
MTKGMCSDDFLKTDGIYIRKQRGKGEKVVLKGTNLGGWLHREGWMDGGGTRTIMSDSAKWRIVETQPAWSTEEALAVLTDGNRNTRWTNHSAQWKEKDYIVMDLGCDTVFNSIELDAGNYANDFPGGCRILVSSDLVHWKEIITRESEPEAVTKMKFDKTNARYIKIIQTGTREQAYWSISEIRIKLEEFYDDYTGRLILKERFGNEKTEQLLTVYQTHYIKESDFDFLKDLGFNFIRLPIYWQEIMDEEGRIKHNAWDQIDYAMEQCGNRGMYLMLDLHGTRGGHSAGWLTGGQTGSNEQWVNSEYQEQTVRIWRAMAERYRNNPIIAAYDLLNEPVAPESSPVSVVQLYDRLYNEVRSIDPDHIISMGAFFDFETLGSPNSNGWENVIYQTHHYHDSQRNNCLEQIKFARDVSAYLVDYQKKWNVPVLAGEFNFWRFTDAWEEWFTLLEMNDISWSNWAYKNIDLDVTNSWGLFHHCESPSVCYENDEYNLIAEKLLGFSTEHYQLNEPLARVMSRFAKQERNSPIIEGALDSSNFIATASENSLDAQNVFNNNRLSGWNSHIRIMSGQWFQVDLCENRMIDGLVMDVGEGENSFPRRFHVQVSHDGSIWENIYNGIYDGTFTGLYQIRFSPQNTRYLRITNTETFINRQFGVLFDDAVHWSMKGLYILGDGTNHPPVFKRLRRQQIKAGEEFILKPEAVDEDGDTLTYSCFNLPEGAAFENEALNWTPTDEQGGFHHLKLQVTDGKGYDYQTICIFVDGKPLLKEEYQVLMHSGDTLVYPLEGKNIDQYKAENLPKGCYLNVRTGVILWSPPLRLQGEFTFRVVGEKKGYNKVEATVNIHLIKSGNLNVRAIYTSQDMNLKLTEKTLSITNENKGTIIEVDVSNMKQPLEGFGSSFDGSTLYNLIHLKPENRERLMRTLFHPTEGANWNFMRICFGSSDFAADVFETYDDMPKGKVDFKLDNFSIIKDIERGYIDYIKEAMIMNPDMRIVASVWSPPAWMKTNESLINGGSVKKECYQVLAQYYAKSVEGYEEQGIPIHAITIQNEPDVVQAYPTTAYTGEEHKEFLKVIHGVFKSKGLKTEIWIMDTNFFSAKEYAWPILNDTETIHMIDGVAFHDYGGEPDVMGEIKKAFPDKSMHLTERSTYNISGADRIIQYFRNGAETYNAWLVFLDERGEPALGPLDGANPPQPIRAPHGNNDDWYCTVDYYFYCQISKYVQRGARVIESCYGSKDTVTNIAFLNPDGSIVVYVVNQTKQSQGFTIKTADVIFSDELPPETAGSYLCGRR